MKTKTVHAKTTHISPPIINQHKYIEDLVDFQVLMLHVFKKTILTITIFRIKTQNSKPKALDFEFAESNFVKFH